MRRRKSIRLRGYDYSQAGAYFITVCTKDRKELLGTIRDGRMRASPIGRVVRECWATLPMHYPNVQLDAFVVMPNHVHGIIVILDDKPHRVRVGEGLRPSPTRKNRNRPPLSEIVRAFKSFSARRINEETGRGGGSFWQRGYYDHIIRNERSLERIRDYISTNPSRWQYDRENTSRTITHRRDPRGDSDLPTGMFN